MGAPTRTSAGRLVELDRDELAGDGLITSSQVTTPALRNDPAAIPEKPATLHNSDDWNKVDWSHALAGVLSDLGRPGLAAQPIVDLTTGEIAGYELLARFGGPEDAPPDVWFLNADRLGLATALTSRVMDHAFALRPHLPENAFFAVNIEPHLLSDPAIFHVLLLSARVWTGS